MPVHVHRDRVRGDQVRRQWGKWVALASVVGLALHGFLTAYTLAPGDRAVFGYEPFDARYLYVGVAVLAVLTIPEARLRPWWLVVMSFTTWGRAVSLIVIGSPEVRTRGAEVRGAVGWVLVWLLGILATLVIEASAVVNTRDHAT